MTLDDQGPPTSAEEYLARVRMEASQLPKVRHGVRSLVSSPTRWPGAGARTTPPPRVLR